MVVVVEGLFVNIIYHPGKPSIVKDDVCQLSMGSLLHLPCLQQEVAHDFHKSANIGVWLSEADDGGVVVQNTVQSS